jgi:hypothetical protein
VSRASDPNKSKRPRASGLSEKLKLAAHLIGQGWSARKACQEAGCDETYISKLRYGLDPAAVEFQKLVTKSLDHSVTTIRTKALETLQSVLDGNGSDKDKVAAAREAEAIARNMVSAEAERAKIRIERERLAIQKEQAENPQHQQLGIVMLPSKSDNQWANGANPLPVPITLPMQHSE